MDRKSSPEIYSFELQVSPDIFRLAAVPRNPILLTIEPKKDGKGAVVLIDRDKTSKLFDDIYKELNGIAKKHNIEALSANQPDKCFSKETISTPSVHFRITYNNGKAWASYYPLASTPRIILDLLNSCKDLARKVFENQPNEQVSNSEAFSCVNYTPEDIILKINKYIYERPNDANAYNDRGGAYLDIHDIDKAVEDFTMAIELNPKHYEAYFSRGWAFYNQAEWEKAIEDFGRAIDLNPKLAKAYNNRGIVYAIQKNYEKAIVDFNKAIECSPHSDSAYNNLGGAYYALKQYDKALIYYSKAIELDPDIAKNHYNRGKVYYDLKKYNLSLSDYNKAIEIDRLYRPAYYNRAFLFMDIKNFKSAKADLTKAIEIDAKDLNAYLNRSFCSLMEKDYVNAIADCDTVIARDPSFAAAYFHRAQIKKFQKKFKESLSDMKKSEELGFNVPKEFKKELLDDRALLKPWWKLTYEEKYKRTVYTGICGILIIPIALRLMNQPIHAIKIYLSIFVMVEVATIIYICFRLKLMRPPIGTPKTASIESLGLKNKLFLKLEVSNAYINEDVAISVKLFTVKGLNLQNIKVPVFLQNELSVIEFNEPIQHRQTVGKFLYDVLEFKANISTPKDGNYRIGPAKVDCHVWIRKLFTRNEAYCVEVVSQDANIVILPKSSSM